MSPRLSGVSLADALLADGFLSPTLYAACRFVPCGRFAHFWLCRAFCSGVGSWKFVGPEGAWSRAGSSLLVFKLLFAHFDCFETGLGSLMSYAAI